MLTADEILQLSKPQSGAGRSDYWKAYHARRQATDPAYRARKTAAALRHKARRLDAEAAGG